MKRLRTLCVPDVSGAGSNLHKPPPGCPKFAERKDAGRLFSSFEANMATDERVQVILDVMTPMFRSGNWDDRDEKALKLLILKAIGDETGIEREACAKVAEDQDPKKLGDSIWGAHMAKRIRERLNQKPVEEKRISARQRVEKLMFDFDSTFDYATNGTGRCLLAEHIVQQIEEAENAATDSLYSELGH